MATYLDVMFTRRAGQLLDGFEEKSQEKFVFRCNYCGDSKTNKRKKRGAIMLREGNYVFKCKNCGVGRPFAIFLKELDSGLFGEYQLEKMNLNRKPVREEPTVDASKESDFLSQLMAGDFPKTAAVKTSPLEELRLVSTLPAGHPALEYLHSRKVKPSNPVFADLRWCENFPSWRNRHVDEPPITGSEGRIVFPLVDRDGNLIGAQGRSLGGRGLRYITVSLVKDAVLSYGMNRVDFSKVVTVVEGAFDSAAFPNCVASLHADLSAFARKARLSRDSTILVFDNEPGNKEVRDSLLKAIDDDWQIAFWQRPSMDVGKDAASAILEKGLDAQDLFVLKKGIAARLEFARWSGKLS